ncbi:MAG TPA: VOC family protein [Gaiellaceae bacterium]
MTRITPYLFYEDAEAAVEFLTNAFGFEEHLRAIGGAGGLHVELRLDGAAVMLGQATWDYENPLRSDNATAMVHAYVADVEALRERARAAGADIVNELVEQPNGDRRCDIRDPEGHMWSFAQAPG